MRKNVLYEKSFKHAYWGRYRSGVYHYSEQKLYCLSEAGLLFLQSSFIILAKITKYHFGEQHFNWIIIF